jgi:RecA/RadA recombinase
MSLMDKLKQNSTIKETAVLQESKLFSEKDFYTTEIPALNIAFSGRIDGGFTSGLTTISGPSKHFKTSFALMMIKTYLSKYKDAICLFYDSEFGAPASYFSSFGIDSSRILHTPITDIEQLKFDCMKQLEAIKRSDRVIVAIDSIGNLASKKEVDDAMDGRSVADMSRAKQLKSFFRMVTPHLNLKDIPMVTVNHTYQTQEIYSKAVVSGGTGIYYSSDTIFIIGRQQEKDGTDVIGYNFVINVEKSRFSREKSKIPVTVYHKGGISKWSGLMDIALESKHVIKPSNGWYSRVDENTGEVEGKKWRLADTDTADFWMPVLKNVTFQQFVKDRYQVASGSITNFEDIDKEMAELETEEE